MILKTHKDTHTHTVSVENIDREAAQALLNALAKTTASVADMGVGDLEVFELYVKLKTMLENDWSDDGYFYE